VHVEGRPSPDGQAHTVQFRRVSPGYFTTMRIRELDGRAIGEQDGAGAPMVAVVSRAFAERLLPDGPAVGRVLRRVAAGTPSITIVGVVDDVRDVSLTRPAEPTLYLPWAQNSSTGMPLTLVIRTAGDSEGAAAAVRAAVLEVDPAMPLRRVQSLDAFLADSIAPERFRTLVLGVMAGLALILASLGIYGVVHRAVVERSHEFAIRLALGAGVPRVVRGVLWSSLADLAAGAVVGALGGIWATGLLARAIDGVVGGASPPLASAVALLVAVAVVATLVPALRVTRLQPSDVLKAR
jgi:putative ABC transport system permease protein